MTLDQCNKSLGYLFTCNLQQMLKMIFTRFNTRMDHGLLKFFKHLRMGLRVVSQGQQVVGLCFDTRALNESFDSYNSYTKHFRVYVS